MENNHLEQSSTIFRHEKDIFYYRETRLDEEIIEDTLSELVRDAQQLNREHLSSHAEAALLADVFKDRARNALSEVENSSKILLRVSGEGVSIPNVELVPAGTKTHIGFASLVPKKSGVRTLLPGEEVVGTLYGVYVTVHQHEDESFGVAPYIILDDYDGGQMNSIVFPGLEIGAVQVTVSHRMLARLDMQPAFKSVALEQVRHREQVMREVALSGLRTSKLVKRIKDLERALAHETSSEFIQLQKIELLREIGEYGAKQASLSERHAEAATALILETLSKGRGVEIGYRQVVGGELIGVERFKAKITDVILPRDASDTFGPTLVVSRYSEMGTPPVAEYVPFEQISDFAF